MEIDLEQVNAFLQVVQTKSFTRAAEALGVSKSSVSRRIAQLEERLGARLLSRTTRQVALTEVGELYFARASEALRSLDDAAKTVASMQEEARGHLRMTAPADFGAGYASLIAAFCARFPNISVEVHFAQRVVDLVGEGFDLALRAGTLPDSSLIARKIARTPHRLYASPAYLQRRGPIKDPVDLEAAAYVAFRGHGTEHVVNLERNGEQVTLKLQSRVAGDSFDFVRELLLEDHGVGELPALLAEPLVNRGELAEVLPEWSFGDAGLFIVYPSGRFVSSKVEAFRDFAVEWFKGDIALAPT